MGVIAGLALFLLGLEQMAKGFRALAGGRVREIIARFTKNPFAGVATGFAACTALDSSSATIIMVIAMISGGLMTFQQALGVVMGANIGTTVGSQIIAFQIYEYAPVALMAGFLIKFAGKSKRAKRIGAIVLGFGLLFFGLEQLGAAVAPLKNDPAWMSWLQSLGDQPLKGALAGCLFTLIIQSSSATVGTAIALAAEGLIPLDTGIALMLGAEIGTVSDTLIAAIGRGREALRTAVFHLVFNVTTVALGLLFLAPLTHLAQALTPGGSAARHIANAHVAFNVLGVALFIWFVPWISRALHWVFPPRAERAARGEPSESTAPA